MYTDTTLDGPDTRTRERRSYSARGTGPVGTTGHLHIHPYTHKTIPLITPLVALYSYCPIRPSTCWFGVMVMVLPSTVLPVPLLRSPAGAGPGAPSGPRDRRCLFGHIRNVVWSEAAAAGARSRSHTMTHTLRTHIVRSRACLHTMLHAQTVACVKHVCMLHKLCCAHNL